MPLGSSSPPGLSLLCRFAEGVAVWSAAPGLRFDAGGGLVSVARPPRLQRLGRLRSITAARDGDLLVTTDNGARDRVVRVSPR